MNIYVGNLSWNLKDQDLSNLFASYGEVISAKIVNDKFTNRSKGFGFVEMANDEQAQAAIAALNGSEVDGRNIVVNESRPKPEGGGSGGGGLHPARAAGLAQQNQSFKQLKPDCHRRALTLLCWFSMRRV